MQVKKGEIFNAVKVAALPRNTFDLTHQHATTINFADLVPICVLETIPGDIFNISCETFLRFQPMITPMMHRCDFTVHYFYVPNRILWEGWENFITGNNALGLGLNTPAAPYCTVENIRDIVAYSAQGRNSLLNYMGCEVNFADNLYLNSHGDYKISALPMAAYQKIYYDYYIARELAQAQGIAYEFTPLNDGLNTPTELCKIRQKGWGRDYFTSALPYAQKGDAVLIPMEGTVELATNLGVPGQVVKASNHLPISADEDLHAVAGQFQLNTSNVSAVYDPNGTLVVNNGQTTINDLRRAMRLQEWLEKNARAGTRYTESLRAHFNVTSSDARLQRAEYITGVKSPIIVSEVLNTTGTTELPQGNMSGHGMGIADGYQESFYCEEHGWIIGVLSVTPKAAYSSGLPRFMTKRMDFIDYFWNEFANIGEQEIEQIELQTDLGSKRPTDVFGYIPRYSEYKFKNDLITGDFANAQENSGSLNSWVMQRYFKSAEPAELNTQFIYNDIKNVASTPFAISDTPIMVQQLNKITASRQMPVYGTPTF